MNKIKFLNYLESLYKKWDDLAQIALKDNELKTYFSRADKATIYKVLIHIINRGDFDK